MLDDDDKPAFDNEDGGAILWLVGGIVFSLVAAVAGLAIVIYKVLMKE